jgi:hypothetical protein
VGMSVRPADDFLLRWPYGGRVRSCDDLRCRCQRKHQRMEAFPSVVLPGVTTAKPDFNEVVFVKLH